MEQLLATTHLTSQVDIKQLLSSEYDSSVEDGAPSSMDESSSPWGKATATLESPSDEYEPSSVRTLGGKLQGALAARNAELSELEKLYRKERRRDREAIRQLRSDNEALQRTAAAAQTRATGELRAYRLSVEAVHARSRAELDELRSQLQALQQEVPTLRAALASSKSDFAQLSVDAPTYEVLRKRPSDELSVVEHVQMRVFDLVAAAERRGAVSAAAAPALTTSAPVEPLSDRYMSVAATWRVVPSAVSRTFDRAGMAAFLSATPWHRATRRRRSFFETTSSMPCSLLRGT